MTPITALILFALITMTALTIEIVYTYATQGFGFGFSSNRPMIDRTALGLRIQRAYQNQVEASSYIVPILAGAALFGANTPGIMLASAIIVAGRAAFVLLYYTGIPFIRILGFTCGSLGSLYVGLTTLITLTG